MPKMVGGCLCGQVRYSCDAEPFAQAVCHCANCQRQAAAPFSVVLGVPEASVEITGTLKTYEDKGDSGAVVYRRFCPECGSPILSQPAAMAGIVFLKAGTLDDTSWLDPKVHVWAKSKQAWTVLPEGVMAFDTVPGA
ncbi:MAG: aldehyde-activating protein [Caulobacter sp.]|nr:aldehyde-activating protein [Caulobacter sp.]